MSKKDLFALVSAILVMAAASATSLAQDKDPAAQLEQAEQLSKDGRVAEAMAIWEDVLPSVGTAMASKLHARLGLGYRKFGKLPEAFYHLTLHTGSTGSPDPKAVEDLAQLTKALPKNWSQVEIVTTPDQATVYFGEGPEGKGYTTPITWWFKPGSHKIHLVKPSFQATTVALQVSQAGQKSVAAYTLSEDQRDGVLQVKGAEVGAQVFIDGLLEGTIPFHRKMKPGSYELMVGRPGLPVWKKQIVVVAGKDVIERPRLKGDDKGGSLLPTTTDAETVEMLPEKAIDAGPKRKPAAWWKWAIAGGGVALVAIGGGLNSAAVARNDELKKEFPDGTYWHRVPAENPVRYKEGYDNEVVPMATTAYVLYGVGAAAAVTGAILLFIPEASPATKATVAPLVAPDTAGISFSLDF
jgi:hypothetical protein